MHLFHNRPLSLACCILAACALLISRVSFAISVALMVLAALLLIVSFVLYLKKSSRAPLLALICSVAAVIAILDSFAFFHVRYPSYQKYVDQECVVEGVVLERKLSNAYGTVLYVAVDQIDGEKARADMLLECSYASPLQVGERFRVRAKGREFEKTGKYDEERAALSDGVVLALVCDSADQCKILSGKSRSLRVLFSEWNARAAFRLESAVGGREGKLCSALLLGNRDGLNGDEALAFERAGVSHLLALSGLHVSILIMIAEWVLRKCYCPRVGRVLTVLLLSVLYLFLTGASLSTARAVCMLGVLTLGFCLQESYDSFTALCISLAFLIVLMPYAVLDIGMWMSFIAAGSIIIFSPVMVTVSEHFAKTVSLPHVLHKAIFGFFGAAFVGLTANLGLAYLQTAAFGNISVLSIPATMVLSIPLSMTLVCSILTLLFPPLGALTNALSGVMLELTMRMSDLENILLPMNDWLTRFVLLALTAALILLAVVKIKRAAWCALPITLAIAAVISSVCVTHVAHSRLTIDRLDGGRGEILLVTQAGDAVAVVGKNELAGGARAIADGMAEARCTELDDLVLTHYYHQATYFLSALAGDVKIRNLRLPPPKDEREEGIAWRLTEEAEARGIKVYFHTDGLALNCKSIDSFS